MNKDFEPTQRIIIDEFMYYIEFSDELLLALQSEYGYQISKQLANVFRLIKEANK